MISEQALPNFFLIGAAKTGTTSLFASLRTHPDVYFPPGKETGFFASSDQYEKGLPYYSKTYFRRAGDFEARGDATPGYFPSTDAAGRISSDLAPAAHRFILVLRDPVARAYSQYLHMVRAGVERASFEQALAEESERRAADPYGNFNMCYEYTSRYATHLTRWMDHYPSDQISIQFHEDLASDMGLVVGDILSFLGLEPFDGMALDRTDNAAGASRFGISRRLADAPDVIKKASDVIPHALKMRLLRGIDRANSTSSGAPTPTLDPDTASRLRASLATEVEGIEELTGRDLAAWKPSPEATKQR